MIHSREIKMNQFVINALLVDPSLFTQPYDAALTRGMLNSSVRPVWITRPLRIGESQEIPLEYVDAFFYKHTDNKSHFPLKIRTILKGLSHLIGLIRLFYKAMSPRVDLVHFQWTVIPVLDAILMGLIRLFKPVILTVHDTTPFNGERISFLQNLGFDLPIKFSNQLIVHTQSARESLIKRGVDSKKINVIPHGPLSLSVSIPIIPKSKRDRRWTFVLFGEIKPYKGFDFLVEAVANLPVELRKKCRCIVAGRPRMDIQPILNQIQSLGLNDVFDVRPQRLSEEEMALLFAQADSFIFPYRQIDASGVYFLVKGLKKWMIATRVGIFAEDMQDNLDGHLVNPENIGGLVSAMKFAIQERPNKQQNDTASSWENIGLLTRKCYEKVLLKKYD